MVLEVSLGVGCAPNSPLTNGISQMAPLHSTVTSARVLAPTLFGIAYTLREGVSVSRESLQQTPVSGAEA